MWIEGLEPTGELSAAAWIAPRLTGLTSQVSGTVPDGFEAYARIFHPVAGVDGQPQRWSDVAREFGTVVHPLMQWLAITRMPGASSNRHVSPSVHGPRQGGLPAALTGRLCKLLLGHTEEAERSWFCIWDGWGHVTGAGVLASSSARTTDDQTDPWPPAQSEPILGREALRLPRLQLPGRGYIVTTGSLAVVAEALRFGDADWPPAQQLVWHSPNLFWPGDHAWCVASEIDFDSTLVGGSQALIDEIVADPEFEARQVGPLDSLASDGDAINPLC